MKLLEEKSILDPCQSGFRKGYSYYDALSRLECKIREAHLQAVYVIAIFLDIEKAYDRLWHHGLMQKIIKIGIKRRMGNFINEFL